MKRRPARRDPWPWVGLGCALAFAVLAALVVGGARFPFDEALTAAVKGLPVPTWLWVACTELGGAIRAPIGAALVVGAVLSRRLRLALIVAVVLVVATLFTDVVKELVARPRPPGEALVAATGYSFPSGHALGSTVTYGLLALVAWRSRLPAAARRAAAIAGVAIPLLVGLSRVALGVHYPTDVLGGWLAGTAFVALAAIGIGATGAMERDRFERAAEAPAAGAPGTTTSGSPWSGSSGSSTASSGRARPSSRSSAPTPGGRRRRVCCEHAPPATSATRRACCGVVQ